MAEEQGYVPFHAFLQQYERNGNESRQPVVQSELVATAPEFVPRQQQPEKENRPQDQGAVRRRPPNNARNQRRNNEGGFQRQRNGYQNGFQNGYRRENGEFHHSRQQQFYQPESEARSRDNSQNNRPDKFFQNQHQKDRRWPKKRDNWPQTTNFRPKKEPAAVETKCQREKLIRELTAYTLECLVCCEKIKDHQSTWSCTTCFHILHLKCTTKWALSSKSDDGSWRCPACQGPKTKVPNDYYCFCGKVRNPEVNRMETAHSCGEVCGVLCENGHGCGLLCHPGPHPACQATVQKSCFCGRTSKMLQCSQKDEIKCQSPCEKLLNCKLHECELTCHAGECENCPKTVDFKCYCGKGVKNVPCSIENGPWSCDKLCEKLLECGNHKCQLVCHDGDCRPCELLPEIVTSCPCGKNPVMRGERKTCLDEIPTCPGVCRKPLRCGQPGNPHICSHKCHTGDCLPCNKKTVIKCRCGNMDQEIKCKQLTTRADDARCKKKCSKMKSCLRHKCQELCCIDFDHICKQTCNKTLSCGKHKCTFPCHRGNCLPCDRVSFDELHCECGSAVIYPPIPCGTKRPVCSQPCSRSHPCDHEVLHPCHTDSRCPPCVILTTKWCYGEHEQRKTIPCHEASFSCGLPCNKPLHSCDHQCIRSCHTGACVAAGEICKQKCKKPRDDCPHPCYAVCHFGKECPTTSCRESVEVQCPCGNLKKMRICVDFTSEYRRIANAQLASRMQEMQNGNSISLSDIMGGKSKPSNGNNKVLECNDECRLLERNRRLEEALGPRDPAKIQMPTYTDFLKTFARKNTALVQDVSDKLTNLVKLAKESKQRSRAHSFPVMNREKRQMVHEMCEAFGISSESYDAEPNRNVVATAYRETCYCPTMSVIEVNQREAGQRVRLPISQNAWRTPK